MTSQPTLRNKVSAVRRMVFESSMTMTFKALGCCCVRCSAIATANRFLTRRCERQRKPLMFKARTSHASLFSTVSIADLSAARYSGFSLTDNLPGATLTPLFHSICAHQFLRNQAMRSEEHTSELQSLMRISYAVFCLKKKKKTKKKLTYTKHTYKHIHKNT